VRLVAAVERERIASREIFLDNCRQGCKVINRLLLVSLMSKMFMSIPIRGKYSIYKLIVLCMNCCAVKLKTRMIRGASLARVDEEKEA